MPTQSDHAKLPKSDLLGCRIGHVRRSEPPHRPAQYMNESAAMDAV